MATASFPSEPQVFDALRVAGRTLKREWTYLYRGAYHFTLADDWSIGVTPESAGRLRIELWRGSQNQCTLWSQALDHPRLEELVEQLATGVAARA